MPQPPGKHAAPPPAARGRHADRIRRRRPAVGSAGWLFLALLLAGVLRREGLPAATHLLLWPAAAALTFALTTAWIHHNKAIYRRKGPRRAPCVVDVTWTRDRLGRPISGHESLRGGGREVVLALADGEKRYRAAA